MAPGLHQLGAAGLRPADAREAASAEALLYVPAGYAEDRPAPLVVLFHGASGVAEHGLGLFRGLADELGLVLLAPHSVGATWDVIGGGYGPDVARVDRALARTFRRVAVDPRRVAVGGFSDGASYALSLGLTNGDLLRRVAAFAPGFVAPAGAYGAPEVYVAHGTRDAVLPIERCSRRIVPALREAGYAVTYREFDGGHVVPPELATEAARWLVDGGAPPPDGA